MIDPLQRVEHSMLLKEARPTLLASHYMIINKLDKFGLILEKRNLQRDTPVRHSGYKFKLKIPDAQISFGIWKNAFTGLWHHDSHN